MGGFCEVLGAISRPLNFYRRRANFPATSPTRSSWFYRRDNNRGLRDVAVTGGRVASKKTKAAYSGFPFGASFSLLASRAHIPIS